MMFELRIAAVLFIHFQPDDSRSELFVSLSRFFVSFIYGLDTSRLSIFGLLEARLDQLKYILYVSCFLHTISRQYEKGTMINI